MKRNKKELQEENDDNDDDNEESEEENKNKINNQFTEKEEIKIESLINSVFKDKSKKPEILEKLRPFFSLKVIPQREIDRVYTAVEKINPEKIDLIEVNEYKEEKYCEKSLFATKSKSVGLSDFDLDLSASILGHKQSVKVNSEGENLDYSQENSSKNHCIHSIIITFLELLLILKISNWQSK